MHRKATGESGRAAWKGTCLLLLSALTALSAGAAPKGNPDGATLLSAAEAARLLQAPPTSDRKAHAVLTRAATAYRNLRSLKSVSRDGATIGVAFLERPGRYRYTQRTVDGQLIAEAATSGGNYYEYQAQTGQYRELPVTMLSRMALPVNVRLFLYGQKTAGTLVGHAGEPVVREFAFRHRGTAKVGKTETERLDVSLMVRGKSGEWRRFTSERYYDVKTGLLRRAVNGGRVMDIENTPNLSIPADRFQWTPPAGATRAFG